MPTKIDRCGCISMQDCHHPLCEYQEPHRHSFACDKACGCGGRGYDVIDPENHPKHVEWRMQRDHERRPVMPTTTERCTCPTASIVCDGPQPDCPVHGYADAAMRWFQMHPDQAPGRTITVSEISKAFGTEYVAWARLCLARIGVTVVPDPEPTNAEKLEKALTDYALQHGGMRGGVDEIAAHLDKAGIRAPGGDDGH